ncbi:hypothetical protein BP6252_08711 [Coleophoma cylindrospora]|uniref:Cell wall mannoprotein n=1 Tax=Coleophoma cylindrospora TaxID=1849047 RepID=A0A3D8R6W8_9HELO|nr:hypothetical protein BP6252_08711 [Coleophoma cylindrospora]
MKYESASLILAFVGLATAAPMPDARNKYTPPTYTLRGREVPQEHSHERFLTGVRINLNLNNPAKIQDPVFGLLGNAAAAVGQGSITNTDCLHQATADQAFTNAKAAGNITGMVDALSYAALERNTGSVGLASVICNETAVNPEVAAIKQHQDPASAGAAATNKAIVLELAKQIASVGGNPQDALLTGTFAAGSTTDNTGKGNSCDTATDPVGCIFTQNLLVNDATAAEITAAVAGITATSATNGTAASAASGNATAAVAASGTSTSCLVTATATVDAPATAAATSAAAATASASTTTTSTSTLDFGTCTDPSILFTNNLADRAGATAFVASNQADFPHGSALGIAVISGFICQRLSSSCGASAAANTACTAGQTASASLTGQAAADAFNSALGLSSSSTAAASTSSTSAVSANVVAAATTSSAASASTSAAASGTNVQTFTGSLGGTAPAVTQGTGTRPFTVNGNTFVGKGAALQRSCAIQHNACATAANGGGQSFTVSDCGTQETACNAAATA